MISEWELWACANHFVTRHGEDAGIVAAMRADELLTAGDLDGAKTMRAIVRRIDQLLARGDGAVH